MLLGTGQLTVKGRHPGQRRAGLGAAVAEMWAVQELGHLCGLSLCAWQSDLLTLPEHPLGQVPFQGSQAQPLGLS